MEIATANIDHDTDLERAVEAASRMIDRYCRRFFYDSGSASARTFQALTRHILDVPDFHTTTGLVVKTDTSDDGTFETTWTVTTDFQVEPADPEEGFPWTRIGAVGNRDFPTYGRRARVQVTARWGWAAVPTPVAQTCLILAQELWKRKDAVFGIAFGATGDAVRLSSNEKAVLTRLDPYRRLQFG